MAARNRRELLVEFKGDTGDLTRAAHESSDALTGVGKAASGPGGLLSKLTPVVDPIQLVGQAFSFAAGAAMDWAAAASEDNKSAAQLAGVIKNVTHATNAQVDAADDWISRLQLQVGIADDELRPAFARLVAVTGDVGTAQGLLTVALDAAAGTGKDYNAIVDALVKAQNGQLGGLSRLGIATTDATGQQLTLAQVLDQMREKWGGLAEQVADQDPMNKATLAWGEMQEMLGSALLPVISKVTTFFVEKLFPQLQEMWRLIQQEVAPVWRDVFQPALNQVGVALDKLAKALSPLLGDMDGGTLVAKSLAFAFQSLGGAIYGVALIVGALADAFGFMVRIGVAGADWLNEAWHTFAANIGKIVDPLMDTWTAFFRWLARLWNATIGKLSFHIPGTNIGFDAPQFPVISSATAPAPASVVLNLPAGTDGHAIVTQLRQYGARVGGLELGAVTAAATR